MVTIIEIPPFKIIIRNKHTYFKMYDPWSRHLSEYSFTLLFILFGNILLLCVHRTKLKHGQIKQQAQSHTVLRWLSQEEKLFPVITSPVVFPQ